MNAHLCREFVDTIGDKHRTSAFRSLKVLKLPRDDGNACVEDIPGYSTRLAQHFRGLLGVTASFITEPPALCVDLKTACHDHRPGDQDIVRGRNRTVALIGPQTGKLGTKALTPQNRLTAIARVSEIERVCHLRYKPAPQFRMAAVTVASEDQCVAADAFALLIAAHDLDAAHAPLLLRE